MSEIFFDAFLAVYKEDGDELIVSRLKGMPTKPILDKLLVILGVSKGLQ